MGIGREPVTGDFLPEMAQLLLGQASFEVGARVDTGRSVALDEQHVTRMLIRGGAPEVVEPDLVEGRSRGVGGDMTAILRGDPVGLHHHRHRIPTDVRLDAPLEFAVAGVVRLVSRRDAVEVRGVGPERQVSARAACVVDQLLKQIMRALGTMRLEDRVDGLQPLAGLARIKVVFLTVRHAIACREICEKGYVNLLPSSRVPACDVLT